MMKTKKGARQEISPDTNGFKFEKNELRMAECLKPNRDVIEALLPEGSVCTLQDAMKKVNEFMKGKVN